MREQRIGINRGDTREEEVHSRQLKLKGQSKQKDKDNAETLSAQRFAKELLGNLLGWN
jgi:hypothetical protein